MPKYAIRSIFVPPPGHVFLAFDLSQAESWASAYLSRDETFKFNLMHKDVHTATASYIFDKLESDIAKDSIERYLGKKANHGLTYWMSAERWTDVINSESEDTGVIVSIIQMRRLRAKWLELYNRIPAWWAETEEIIRRTRQLTTPYGRKRTFFGHLSQESFKEGVAYVPQSTVADHALGCIQPELGIEGGLLGVRRLLKRSFSKSARLVHTAHDSIMLEVRKEAVGDLAPLVYKQMLRPVLIHGEECLIPVDGEIGERWGELEKLQKSFLAV